MADETEIGPSGAPDRRGHPRGGSGEQSPLQARAEFLKNRSWELVVGLNQGACARGGAHVETRRGSTRGVIVSILPDGRVAWRPDGSESELVALPESLLYA